MTEHLLDELNPPQRQAVTTTDGPLLIIAGAGSGKTRVITYRVAYLVRECGVGPGQIFAATFTNKAADEMRERVRGLLGGDRGMPFAMSTFHSWCARVLRREAKKIGIAPDYTICDDDDQISALKEVLRGLGLDPKKGPILPAQARAVIDNAKGKLQTPDDLREEAGRKERAHLYADIYAAYQDLLRRNNALDFGDLLVEVVRLLETDAATRESYQNHYRYLMVDEYQDTNHVQYRLVAALASRDRNICVVGDEDQSIYSWRGADLGNLLDFQKQFPDAKLIRLEQNYRSTQNILSLASTVIARNKERLGKALWTDRGGGPPILTFESAGDWDEADNVVTLIEWFHRECFIPYSEMAVFYRINALSRLMEERLRAADIPYQIIGGLRFYDRKEIKDLLAYLRVVANPYDSMALARIINTPRRGIGNRTVEKIVSRAFDDRSTFFEAIEKMRKDKQLPKAADRKVSEFVDLLNRWIERSHSLSIAALLDVILDETQYIDSLGDPETIEVISRCENIDELKNAIVRFERDQRDATLRDFLEYTSLRTSTDEYETDEDSISLMTIHCAKGLEFRVVFLVALEAKIFPHALALKEGGLEEERRLFYVGCTRAKDVLCLSCAANRYARGESQWNAPSQFLLEAPREMLHWPETDTLEEVRSELVLSGEPDEPKRKRSKKRRKKSDTAKKLPLGRGASKWQPGQTIVHPELGNGIITEVRGSSGGEMLLVEFEDGFSMEFLARHARLKRG